MKRERNRGGFGAGQEGCPGRMPLGEDALNDFGPGSSHRALATGTAAWVGSVEGMAFHGGV